ncbi:MAG TPA: 50S ribosomal protein L4 [Nocardioidaceae bacterium]|nr:50S ribosomal protein L4 [Nocardioidaceae bacterium]
MTSVDVHAAGGSTAGKVELPARIFDVTVNVPLIHQVVVAQLAAARQGTHSTKTRSEVSGGGRKPYRQKGTGRARQGSIRAPQFTGGAVVHGPRPHGYDQRTPKKMKAAALRGALSDRARDGRVHVVDTLAAAEAPSTKGALAVLRRLTSRPRTLVVLERADRLGWLSLRNVDTVHLLAVDQLNTYDVLQSDDVVFTRAAFDALVSSSDGGAAVPAESAKSGDRPAGRAAAPAAAEPAPRAAEEAPADAAQSSPDSAEPLADGSAPEGFTIKGNRSSMKYHLPGGRWYDATVAEVWFRTEEAAKAAGFVKAGTRTKATSQTEEGGR